MRVRWLLPIAAVLALLAYPPQWYPRGLRVTLAQWFGASQFRPLPESRPLAEADAEPACPPDLEGWRAAQTIADVSLAAAPTCVADNPYAVAAFVRGTNNVSQQLLMQSGLTPDAVEKGRDLDGDGDPDEIHIRLEVVELNGGSPELDQPTTQFAIAPGIQPGLWVFAPKMFGMATDNFESLRARDMLRAPSPAIRIEQGDKVQITLENSHYMPHTIHFHGIDHSFVDQQGEGNDGVPIASELPVMPGGGRTYEMQPRNSGTKFYHCHVQPQAHVMMGLQGLFVIEENRPDNWVQTLNVGAGLVRAPAQAVLENYDQEYDLHYMDIDAELNERVQQYNDPRLITESIHRQYDITDATADYFLLNGRSFPYTFRESLVTTQPDQLIKLRVANGGLNGIALHTHGHTVRVTHRDGIAVDAAAQEQRDVVWIATAQRLDLALNTSNDGSGAYGSGIWLFHDHQYRAVTTDGIGPGGHISAIVYDQYLADDGWPATRGVSWEPYFSADYYRRQRPVWASYGGKLFLEASHDGLLVARLLLLALALGGLTAAIGRSLIGGPRR